MRHAIVCLDDEIIIVEAMRQELRERFGKRFLYETALSADEARDVLSGLVEDGITVILIISDWLMPGMKGDEFLAEVRARYPGLNAIMVTGQADEDAIERVLSEGLACCIVRKPWKVDELTRAVESCLGERDAARGCDNGA